MSWTAILVVVAFLAALAVAFLIFRPRAAPRVERRPDGESTYVASKERPYIKPPDAEGAGVADEVAQATTDVAGEVLGVKARPVSGPADDLSRLKGVGPKFVVRLNELGITRYEQLGEMNANEAAHLDQRMGPFQGRLARDRVIEQADYLARGDVEGFEEKFGKLGG